jgi:hypothetical protein
MYPQPLTPCECEAAGFCQRHQCEKTRELMLACRLNVAAFNRWENGEGPCLDQMRLQAAKIASGARSFAELARCRHRSEEPAEQVECELCGGRTELVDVFACAMFGKCTPRRYGSRTEVMRNMPSCIRCEKYETIETNLVETTMPDLEPQSSLHPPAS